MQRGTHRDRSHRAAVAFAAGPLEEDPEGGEGEGGREGRADHDGAKREHARQRLAGATMRGAGDGAGEDVVPRGDHGGRVLVESEAPNGRRGDRPRLRNGRAGRDAVQAPNCTDEKMNRAEGRGRRRLGADRARGAGEGETGEKIAWNPCPPLPLASRATHGRGQATGTRRLCRSAPAWRPRVLGRSGTRRRRRGGQRP